MKPIGESFLKIEECKDEKGGWEMKREREYREGHVNSSLLRCSYFLWQRKALKIKNSEETAKRGEILSLKRKRNS
jgi:hypothetical protein